MNIHIYGINYAPELTGIGKYTGEMAQWLAAQGHRVEVFTAMPYYPEWQVHTDYRRRWWHREHINGVTVRRTPLYVPKKVSAIRRILHEMSFVFGLLPFWCAALFRTKADVVISIAPPFHLGFLPWSYTRLKGSKLLTHIQDLQVDAARDLGMIRNHLLLNTMFRAERFLLRQSDAVSSISEGMKQKILAKGIHERQYLMLPNWVDEAFIHPLPMEQSLRGEWGISHTDKVVLYAGNLGEKQGLEIIIDAAGHFMQSPEVRFIIVGNGGAKRRLEAMAAGEKLENIRFYPLQPYEKLSALLATADIHLVLQKKSAADLVMPSKLTGILAAGGCPLVTASPGTSLYQVIETHQVGILVEPESVAALVSGIEKGLNGNLEQYRANARSYATAYLSKQQIMDNIEDSLMALLPGKRI